MDASCVTQHPKCHFSHNLMKKKLDYVKAWGEAFYEVLDPHRAKPSQTVEHDERLIHTAIQGLSSILTLKCVNNHEVPLSFKKHGDMPILKCFEMLMNVYDLPVAFSVPARCLALKTLGSIVRSMGHDQLNDPLVKKAVVKISALLKFATVEENSQQLCAHAWALGRLAIDPESRRNLARFVEQFVKDFENRPANVQIALCKAIQYMDLVNETLVNKLHEMSKSRRVGLDVSAYASLAWITTTVKRHGNLKMLSIITHFVKVLEEESDPTVIKACLKVIYVITLKDPESRETGVKALRKYLMVGNTCFRDRAFVLLAKYANRYDDEQLQKKLLSIAVAHIESRITTDSLLPNVVTGMCLIGMHNLKYAKQVHDVLDRMLSQRCFFPGIVFKCYIGHDSEWDDGMTVEPHDCDLFAKVAVPKVTGESVEMTYEWKSTRRFVASLYNINLFERYCGMKPPGRIDMTTCPIYEDVVAHFLIAVSHPKLSKTTVPSLFNRLRDKQKQDRRRYIWEDIQSMLESYSTTNYCQLLYALILCPKLCSEDFLRWMIKELDNSLQNYKQRTTHPASQMKRKPIHRPPLSHGLRKR